MERWGVFDAENYRPAAAIRECETALYRYEDRQVVRKLCDSQMGISESSIIYLSSFFTCLWNGGTGMQCFIGKRRFNKEQ